MHVHVNLLFVNEVPQCQDQWATSGFLDSLELEGLVSHLRTHQHTRTTNIHQYSCIEIYAHSCLKPFSVGRKPCSNCKTHVQIMKFTCRLNMGFGRRHWSMRRDIMCFGRNKMADVEEAPRFSASFYVVNVIFKRF